MNRLSIVPMFTIMDDKPSLPSSSINVSSENLEALRIRTMTQTDIDRVHLIDQLSFSMPWPRSSYLYELTENKTSLIRVGELPVNESTTLVVAMIVTWLIVDEAHIATIAVHPNYRRLGIGKKLLANTLEESILRGVRMATLEVRQGNFAAINMYSQFGFKVAGRRSRYYHDTQEDAFIMTVNGLGQAYLDWLRSPDRTIPPETE